MDLFPNETTSFRARCLFFDLSGDSGDAESIIPPCLDAGSTRAQGSGLAS